MRSEIERLVARVIRVTFRKTTPNIFVGRFSDRQAKILPSFNGELGFEIIHFLSRVEPYLRNGWRILARRPALYPPGTAFYDPLYFAELDKLVKQYELHPTPVGLRQPIQRLEGNFKMNVARGDLQQVALQVVYEMPDILAQESRFELQLRDLFYSYCDVNKRGVIDIDTALLSCQPSRVWDVTTASRPVLRPSYQPEAFLRPSGPQRPHIGVQLRALGNSGKHPSGGLGRDSDPAFVLPLAERAAAHLGLPILIYGRPGGNLLPDGYEHTFEPDIDLLDKELQLLSACRLMFAPDSGWADLMAWLRVPTLLEGSVYSGHFDDLIGFEPRIMLIDRTRPIEEQITALLAADLCIPNDTRGMTDYESDVHTRAFLSL